MSSIIHSGGHRSSTRRAHASYSEVNNNINEILSLSAISTSQNRPKKKSRSSSTQEKRHHSPRTSNSGRKTQSSKTVHIQVKTSRPALNRSDSSKVRDSASRQQKSPIKQPDTHSKRAQQTPNRSEKSSKESEASHSRPSVQKDHQRPSSILSVFFNAPPPPPVKKVTCITCLSDDIPITKSAKLACSHRMCYSCLRRIFTLSITDPQHMPPRCCTQDHIPTKYVERLFDQKFKMKWNLKYKEYTTKNRYYCCSKTCGEWIKPTDIFKDRDGKSLYGKCPRCKTKVCCLCRGKWHGNKKECPKDETVQRLEKMAKENGWQRCYNCSSFVELKEGCNHMTCRCTAQFCMLCGSKWKTCDCPWFNYDTTRARAGNWIDEYDTDNDGDDGDNERNAAVAQPNNGRGVNRPEYFVHQFLVGRHPMRYQDELYIRREQEWGDLDLARRLQRLEMEDEDD